MTSIKRKQNPELALPQDVGPFSEVRGVPHPHLSPPFFSGQTQELEARWLALTRDLTPADTITPQQLQILQPLVLEGVPPPFRPLVQLNTQHDLTLVCSFGRYSPDPSGACDKTQNTTKSLSQRVNRRTFEANRRLKSRRICLELFLVTFTSNQKMVSMRCAEFCEHIR